jgi:hypothetical protein
MVIVGDCFSRYIWGDLSTTTPKSREVFDMVLKTEHLTKPKRASVLVRQWFSIQTKKMGEAMQNEQHQKEVIPVPLPTDRWDNRTTNSVVQTEPAPYMHRRRYSPTLGKLNRSTKQSAKEAVEDTFN